MKQFILLSLLGPFDLKGSGLVQGLETCNTTTDCHGPGHVCHENACVKENPFQSGCLKTMLPDWKDRIRVCHSDDDESVHEQGLCYKNPLDYAEMRLFAYAWESAVMGNWVLQILLSELLGVPTSIEAGVATANLDFYSPYDTFRFGNTRDLDALDNAQWTEGDCRLASRDESNYISCAHVVMEVWDSGLEWVKERVYDGVLEPPQDYGCEYNVACGAH